MQCKNILVLDDDEAIREIFRVALKRAGYGVVTADNGQTGMDELKHMPRPCLILLDLMMPVMDGWEFVSALHKDENLASIPVIVITAFNEKAKNVNARGIMRKPVELEELLATAKEFCGPGELSYK